MTDRRDSAVVAVDVGSTAARAGVFDRCGRLLARSEHPFATCRPAPGHAEHSSEDIWQACCRAVRTAVGESGVAPASVRGPAFDALARLNFATAVGIALGTRHILDALNRQGYAIPQLHLTGGQATNPVLVQLYADATRCQVVLPEEADGVVLGTACVAAAASSLDPGLNEACTAMVRSGSEVAPDAGVAEFFDRRYESDLLMPSHRQAVDRAATGVAV